VISSSSAAATRPWRPAHRGTVGARPLGDEIRAKASRASTPHHRHDNVSMTKGSAGLVVDYLAYGTRRHRRPGLQRERRPAELHAGPGGGRAGGGDGEARSKRPRIDGTVATAAAGGDSTSRHAPARQPSAGRARHVPVGRTDATQTVSVENPTEFLVGEFRRALLARGIEVTGGAVDVDTLPRRPTSRGPEPS